MSPLGACLPQEPLNGGSSAYARLSKIGGPSVFYRNAGRTVGHDLGGTEVSTETLAAWPPGPGSADIKTDIKW